MMSQVYDDHDYVCCRGTKVVNRDQHRRSNVPSATGGAESKREVNTFWKVGHDSRRKLCVVGFNWNSSQLRLNKLGAGKSGASSSSLAPVDGRTKPREKSARSRMVLSSCESTRAAETTGHSVSGADKPEVVKGVGQQQGGGTKRRSKVYIYKPRTDCGGARSTTAKAVALVNKPTKGKAGNGNALLPSEDETSTAVQSIIPPSDLQPLQPQKRAGEYTIHLSSTGSSKPSPVTRTSPDYGYLSSLLREPMSGISPGCEAMSAAAASLQQIIEGGMPTSTSSSSSTAPLGIPSPFLLQTGLEQALGFAAFHPMSPSTSSSSCSRVAGDEWPSNDDDDLISPKTGRLSSDSTSGSFATERCVRGSADGCVHGYCSRSAFTGNGDASNLYSADRGFPPTSQPEPVFFDDFSTAFNNDGDLRYESSSFVVCEDNWDGYQREEQVDDCWSQHSPPFTQLASGFGRKSGASRFRFTDTGIITTLGSGGPCFGRAVGRSDRRRKQPEDRRNRKSMNGAGITRSDEPETVSAPKKSCRQRLHCDRSKHSTDFSHSLSEATDDVNDIGTAQTTSSTRRRKQPTSSRKKSSAAGAGVESLSSDASDCTPKIEGASKKRSQLKSSGRAQLEGKPRVHSSAVRYLFTAVYIE